MGKQVRFYMLPEDEALFLDFVLGNGDTVLLSQNSHKPEPEIIKRRSMLSEQNPDLRNLVLWHTGFSLSEKHFEKIELTEYNQEQMTYITVDEIVYPISCLNAPVIEFSRSFVGDNGVLVKGRIWAEMNELEDDQIVYKGTEFEKWYDSIARWIRQNFQRIDDIDGYFGKDALKWQEELKPLANRSINLRS